MKKISCPNCDESLEMNNKHYMCPLCEREWDEILLSSKKYHDAKLVNNVNAVFAEEYSILSNLLEKKQIYGIVFQIKDIYEILIRIPVLISTAYLLKKDVVSKAKELICYLLSKPLSLGDWRYLLNLAYDALKENYDGTQFNTDIIDLVASVRKLVNSNKNGDIVYWRNSMIAHGATKQINDETLYDDAANHIEEITKFLSEHQNLFDKIQFIDDKNEELVGPNCDFSKYGGKLFLQIGKETLSLYPFFDLRNDGIYLFDRYIQKIKRTDLIEYINSLKESLEIKEFNNLYMENIIANNNSANFETYSVEERNLCEELLNSGEYLEPSYLVDWLKSKISSNKKVFMLLMGKGMGKSFFVKGLDPFSLNNINIEDLTVKAFYINSTYNSRINDFSIYVEDVFRKISVGHTLANASIRLNINTDNPKKEFANFLNEYKKKYYSSTKLLFIFDGLDEMSEQEGYNISDFIPQEQDLDDDIFVLITSRTTDDNDKISNFCRNFIRKFEGEKTTFISTDENYLKFAKNFFDMHIIKKLLLFIKRNNAKPKIDYKITDAKFTQLNNKTMLNLSLIKELLTINVSDKIRNGAKEIDISALSFDENMYEIYFKNLKNFYGGKYYSKFINVLCCLTIADRPLSLKELAVLSSNNNLNFAFLGFVNSMKLFLDTEREDKGTYFCLSHASQRKAIYKIFTSEIDNLMKNIAVRIIELSKADFDYSNDEDISYFVCFNSLINYFAKKDSKFAKEIFLSLLNLPLSFDWSKKTNLIIQELNILKNTERYVEDIFEFDVKEKIKICLVLSNVGFNELVINNYNLSEYYFSKAYTLYKNENVMKELNIENKFQYAQFLSYYSTLRWRVGDNLAALNLYKDAFAIQTEINKTVPNIVSKIQLLSENVCLANIANSCKDYDLQKSILEYVEKEIDSCDSSELKDRTYPFINLCWFYFYRDQNDFDTALKHIKTAIKQSSVCIRNGSKVYPSDLIKSYIFLIKTLTVSKKFNKDDFALIKNNLQDDLNYIKEYKKYEDKESFLALLISLYEYYLHSNDKENIELYENKINDFYLSLSETEKNNPHIASYILEFKNLAGGKNGGQ